jgi:hypothetical protein
VTENCWQGFNVTGYTLPSVLGKKKIVGGGREKIFIRKILF